MVFSMTITVIQPRKIVRLGSNARTLISRILRR